MSSGNYWKCKEGIHKLLKIQDKHPSGAKTKIKKSFLSEAKINLRVFSLVDLIVKLKRKWNRNTTWPENIANMQISVSFFVCLFVPLQYQYQIIQKMHLFIKSELIKFRSQNVTMLVQSFTSFTFSEPVWPSGKALVRLVLVSRRTSVRYCFSSPFSSKRLWFVDTVLWLCLSLPTETLKWLSSLPTLMQESCWWWQCSDRYIISLFPPSKPPSAPPPPPPPPLLPVPNNPDC